MLLTEQEQIDFFSMHSLEKQEALVDDNKKSVEVKIGEIRKYKASLDSYISRVKKNNRRVQDAAVLVTFLAALIALIPVLKKYFDWNVCGIVLDIISIASLLFVLSAAILSLISRKQTQESAAGEAISISHEIGTLITQTLSLLTLINAELPVQAPERGDVLTRQFIVSQRVCSNFNLKYDQILCRLDDLNAKIILKS